MSLFSRLTNVFRHKAVDRDIDEELQSHFDEAVSDGRDPDEVRRAFGSRLRIHEAAYDVVVSRWLDSVFADVRFGFRQLLKRRGVSVAAILSLGLAMGASMAAFRLIDAALLRPLPVSNPRSLYMLGSKERGLPDIQYSFDYPGFRELREAMKGTASVMAISYPQRISLSYSLNEGADDQEMERVLLQFVSGSTFGELGLSPAGGRLLTEADDQTPKARPYAVISYDYWSRRFGKDPGVVGRKVRVGNDLFEIIGVSPKGFTGTETGLFTDIFFPMMMYFQPEAFSSVNWHWLTAWFRIRPGVTLEQTYSKLQPAMLAHRQEQVREVPPGAPQHDIDEYLASAVVLTPAAAGVSDLQRNYGQSLTILGLLVALVLLVACVNVANLMTAQAAARAREIALRVSIGAGRARLVQLVLVQSLLITAMAAVIAVILAWQASPFVVSMINIYDAPIRLELAFDGRALGFAALLILLVTTLFGLTPAFQASAITPAIALKGGSNTRSRQRLMHGLIAAQVAFCVMVLLVAGLFVSTFKTLANRPLGFSSARLITLESVTRTPKDGSLWYQVVDDLRSVSGVEDAAVAGWALMSGTGWNGYVWANGHTPESETRDTIPWFLGVSPTWLETMKIPLLQGRPFTRNDAYPRVAIVNETFAQYYFQDQSPVGKTFDTNVDRKRTTIEIVGVAGDARYTGLRRSMPATVYVPFQGLNADGTSHPADWATFVIRTQTTDSRSLSSLLREGVRRNHPDFRVAAIRTQDELVRLQTIRERLLATLSIFFAVVAIVLAGVGLFGVLNYAVIQRRRELGIRIALGAKTSDLVRRISIPLLTMVVIGTGAGIALGMFTARYVSSLLFMVSATDPSMLFWPSFAMFLASLVASLSPVLRAIRIHPASLLRVE
jgi:predicted permease